MVDYPKTILVDVDGCISNYDFPKLLKKYFGVTLREKYIYSIEDSLGVCPSEVTKMFEKEVHNKPIMIPGAVESLKAFISAGHKVNIYSNRLYFMTQPELEDWLQKCKVPFTSICTNSTLPSYVHTYVDDSPAKMMAVDKVTEVKNLLLFTAPHNKKCLNITGRMQRVNNWKQVRKIVDG